MEQRTRTNRKVSSWTDEEIRGLINNFIEREGRIPNTKDLKAPEMPPKRIFMPIYGVTAGEWLSANYSPSVLSYDERKKKYAEDFIAEYKKLRPRTSDEYNERKLVGTSVQLEQGGICPIDVTVYVKLMSNASSIVVESLVRNYIKDRIYAGAYDFGECPEPSDLIIDITNLDGVRASDVDISGVENLTSKDVITLGTLTVQFLNNNPTPERVIRYANR